MDRTALHARLVELLELNRQQEYAILDFGCGTGELLAQVSSAVAAGSRLVGLDAEEKSISWAKHQFGDIEFEHSKFLSSFDLADASFDVFISVDTLECIPDKDLLLREIARILKPGGRVLIAHWDWDTQVYNSSNTDSARKLVASFADWQQGWMDACDGQMGRKLWGLLEGSGLFSGRMYNYTLMETEFSAGNYGFERFKDVGELVAKDEFPLADYELLKSEFQSLNDSGKYFYSLNSYIYVGEVCQDES